MQITLTKSFRFDAAHWLPTFPDGHKCRRLHGHTFQVEVMVHGEVDADQGYLIDYGELKAAIQPIEDQLDHHLLNEIPGLENPTAENLARWIYDRLRPAVAWLSAVRVHETCTSTAEYRGAAPAPGC